MRNARGDSHIASEPRLVDFGSIGVQPLRPALADIPAALRYLGSPSRAKFYQDLLPNLDVIKFGVRTFVTYESLDRLIAAHRQSAR
jgi:hypothetical protein